ncbi:MAG TPA: alginate lyase family protein, partial [Myxococcota bacterium]
MSLIRLFHTIRWLGAAQLAAQLRYRARGLTECPERWRRRPVPGNPGVRWAPRADFLPPGPQDQRAERLLAGDFRFLNRTEQLGWPPRWADPGLPRLWAYHLHYFDYLWALPHAGARRLALDWIARHPLGRGRVGWEPYPVSLRLMNWCGYFFGRHREATLADPELRAALWASLQLQADWLAAHLEHHLRGNHLLENAAALAACGACFAGDSAQAWLQTGIHLLDRELPEQILADGGHLERSPMYQLRVAYVLAFLANTGDAALTARVEEPLARLRHATVQVCHPDGEIALLNDSAFGIASPPGDLLEAAAPPGPFALPETGYYGARSAAGRYVVCDAAPIGPDYLPGHAHGDIFSFELSLGGRRVIVDAGVHGYEADAMRSYCRSTRAHNTLEVEGQDQCEFWAAFRVARRGRPRDVAWRPLDAGFELEGWHDGYERLPGRPRHRRRFRWHAAGVLLVRDEVRAGRPVRVCSRLHLHPDCEIVSQGERAVRVRHPGGTFSIAFDGPGQLSVEPSSYCPEFGVVREGRALVLASRGAAVETGFCVADRCDAVEYELAR